MQVGKCSTQNAEQEAAGEDWLSALSLQPPSRGPHRGPWRSSIHHEAITLRS